MAKVAIVILSSTEVPESHGRFIHALHTGKELKDSGHEVKVIFEGIGVTWLQAFHQGEHPVIKGYGSILEELRPQILGTCDFCTTRRFQVQADASALGIPLLGSDGHHYSHAELITEGYQILQF